MSENFESSQFLPKTEGEDSENPSSGTLEHKEPKATEHGVVKDAESGSTLTADSTSNNPETLSPPTLGTKSTASVSANKPNNTAVTEPLWKKKQRELKEKEEAETKAALNNPAPTPKTSATNPANAPGANYITDISTESDEANGITILAKRADGTTLQFPMTFIGEKQDVYNTRNMLDLMGKLVKKSAKELEEEFPAFMRK